MAAVQRVHVALLGNGGVNLTLTRLAWGRKNKQLATKVYGRIIPQNPFYLKTSGDGAGRSGRGGTGRGRVLYTVVHVGPVDAWRA